MNKDIDRHINSDEESLLDLNLDKELQMSKEY